MKRLELHWRIIIGMILGVSFGLISFRSGYIDFTNDWIKPWGIIFVNLLKLIAVPLVFASLVKGVYSLSNISKLSRIGGKSVLFYLFSTIIAVSIGLLLVNFTNPGVDFSKESVEIMLDNTNTQSKIDAAEQVKKDGPLQFIVDIIPVNIFTAASDNTNMLQIIFFALLFGIAIILLPKEKTIHVRGLIDGLNDIILKIVELIMNLAPYGVFSLLACLIVDFGASNDLFVALAKYSITVILGLLIMIFIFYPFILMLFTKVKYRSFFSSISPAQMLAFSTSSSAATLPVTMERCEGGLGISKEVTSFVLPLGATINMDGTSLYQAVAAVFIAQVFGIDLDITQQLTIVLTATLASIGAAAVPGAGMVMLVIVLGAINVPAEGLALIFGVDRILDMLRTVVNVTGDATIATAVASSENKINLSITK